MKKKTKQKRTRCETRAFDLSSFLSILLNLLNGYQAHCNSDLRAKKAVLAFYSPLGFVLSCVHACFNDINNIVAKLLTFLDEVHVHRADSVGIGM